MTELVILDLDGTLVNSFADIRGAIVTALAEVDVEATEELLDMCRLGIGLEVFYERATGKQPRGAGLERFVNAYRRDYFDTQSASRAYPGVVETLAALRRAHPDTAIAVATTKRTDMAITVTERCGLAEHLDYVRGSDGLAHKPDPAILLDVAEATNRSIENAVMVGDTDRDVLAAHAAGCRSVAVTYGGWRRDELEPLGPTWLIDQFDQLFAILR